MRQQKGISMLEVLVGLMIVSIASMGILKLEWTATQAVSSSYFATIALIRCESLASFNNTVSGRPSGLIQFWQTENKRYLPEVKSEVQGGQLQLSWYDPGTRQRNMISMAMQ